MRENGQKEEQSKLLSLMDNQNNDNDIYLPIEILLLRYQLTNNITSLSNYNIETVIKQFITNHSILKHFDTKPMIQDALIYYSKYVNKSLLDIFTTDNFIQTWDNYAISIVFLRILIGLHKSMKTQNKFIILFMKLLVKNISLDPSKRLSLINTMEQFELLLNNLDINVFKDLIQQV
jgi:predicted nucleic-acid-binding protein